MKGAFVYFIVKTAVKINSQKKLFQNQNDLIFHTTAKKKYLSSTPYIIKTITNALNSTQFPEELHKSTTDHIRRATHGTSM